MAKTNPELIINEIQDLYLRRNFSQLDNYFKTQNQLLDFKFFEVKFTATSLNQKVNHGLKFIPKDVVFLGATNNATVSFNIGNFTLQSMDISSNKETTLRFFIGKYFNDQANPANNKDDVLVFGPDQATSESITIEKSSALSVISVSLSYMALSTDDVILVNATASNITVTLPLASKNKGKKYTIKKSDGTVNKVIIARSGSDYVETGTSFALYNANDRVEFVSSGTGWEITSLSITKESVVCTTATVAYSQTANTWITAPLSTTSDSTRYPITSNTITVRKTAKYRIICRNSFISTNGELGYVTYSVNGASEASNYINGYLMDANPSGSTSQITESRELTFSEGDILRLRTHMSTNTRAGNNGRLELMEI